MVILGHHSIILGHFLATTHKKTKVVQRCCVLVRDLRCVLCLDHCILPTTHNKKPKQSTDVLSWVEICGVYCACVLIIVFYPLPTTRKPKQSRDVVSWVSNTKFLLKPLHTTNHVPCNIQRLSNRVNIGVSGNKFLNQNSEFQSKITRVGLVKTGPVLTGR